MNKSAHAHAVPRVTSLKHLSLAEFSGEQVRPKVYENGHKDILAIWFDLVSNVKIWAHFLKIKYVGTVKIKITKICQ